MIKFGYMGPGDYFVARGSGDDSIFLGRVAKTSSKWEAWLGSEGLNVNREFRTRQEAGDYLASLKFPKENL